MHKIFKVSLKLKIKYIASYLVMLLFDYCRLHLHLKPKIFICW